MSSQNAVAIIRTTAQMDETTDNVAVSNAAVAKFEHSFQVYGDIFRAISVAMSYLREERGEMGHSFGC